MKQAKSWRTNVGAIGAVLLALGVALGQFAGTHDAAGALIPLEQQIDERAISEVGGHPSGRGVWLVDVTELFQLRQHVADRCRRKAKSAAARNDLRRYRLTAIDVLAHERRQEATRPFG